MTTPLPSLEPIKFANETITFVTPSWDDLSRMAFAVATQVRAAQIPIDRVVTLSRGGWPLARTLVDFLGITQVASVGVKFYSGVGERMARPEVYQDVSSVVAGERVLLFDDVADSGESLQFAYDYLLERQVAACSTATLLYKPHSKFKPDFFALQTSSWIVFPYELAETVGNLSQRWGEAGVNQDEVTQRLVKLSFPLDLIEYYLNLGSS